MPITASCGTRPRRIREAEKMAAPRTAAPRPKARLPELPGSWPKRNDTMAPKATIWARARSTKITSRRSTWIPK